MIVHARVKDAEVAAHVRVLDAANSGKAEAQSGESVPLSAGQHRIEVQLSDASVLVDMPTQTLDVALEPGKQTEVNADFPWSKIQLNVLVNGHSQNGVQVKLLQDERVVAQLKSGDSPVGISPGKFEADVFIKGTTIRVKGLLFTERATQVVPVRVQF